MFVRVCITHLVLGQLVAGAGELLLDETEAVLEDGDDADAAVDGVSEAHVGLVGERVDGVLALVGVELVEDLGHVAGAEDAVHAGELGRVVGREVGREDASLRALAPQQLARGARRVRRRHRPDSPPPAGRLLRFLLLLLRLYPLTYIYVEMSTGAIEIDGALTTVSDR